MKIFAIFEVDKKFQVEYKCSCYKILKTLIKCTYQNFKISAFSKTLLEKLKARDCHKNLSVHISDICI